MTQARAFYGWKLLAVLWLILVTNLAFPLYGASVINTYMAADLHFDRSTLGFGFAMFQWMTGLPGPLVALAVNRKGVRFTILMGTFLVLVGSLIMALLVHTSIQYHVVFGIVIALGIITAGPLTTQSGIARWFVRRKALAISLLLTGPAVGGFIAPPVLDRVIAAHHGNWRAGWWLVVGLSIFAGLLAALFVREYPADLGQFPDGDADSAGSAPVASAGQRKGIYRTSDDWTFGEVLRTRTLWLILVSLLGFSAGYSLFLAHGVVHLKDLGHTPAEAAFSFSVLLLALLSGNLIVAAIGDSVETRFLWAIASASFGIGLLLALKATGTAGLYIYAVFLGVGFGMAFSSVMTLPSNYFGAKAYPSVIGVILAVATTAGAAGAFGAGYAYDHYGSYARAFYIVAALCFIGSVLALAMTPPVKKETHLLAAAASQQYD